MTTRLNATCAALSALVALIALAAGGCKPADQAPGNSIAGKGAKPPAAQSADPISIESLRHDIETLQLLARMDLKPEQSQELLAAVEDALPAVQTREAEAARTAAQLAEALGAKRDDLLAGRAPSPKSETALRDLEARYQASADAPAGDVSALNTRLEKTLSHQQLRLLAGSVEARIRAGDILDGYRRLPQDEYEAQISGLAEELATESQGMTADQLQGLFTDARSLSDKEYGKGREKLLDQLEPLFLPDGEAMRTAIYERLVTPGSAEILRKRAGTTH
jgi:hypothetical protein